jgi:hypothetical protein
MVDVRRFISILICLLALLGCARAQFIGYISPQTVQTSLATGTLCTGAAQTFITGVNPAQFSNIGQTHHVLSIASVIGASKFQAEIDGIDRQGNVFRISDIFEGLSGSVSADGYFPQIQVQVTCSPGTATFTASYSGTSVPQGGSPGTYLIAQIDKTNFSSAPENATITDNGIQTPFGSSAGTIQFQYLTASIANSTLAVNCKPSVIGALTQIFITTLANVTTLQTFQIPDIACSVMSITYTTGGGGAGTFNSEYMFSPPGRTVSATQYTHITGTTATTVKATAGFLHTVNINTGNAVANTVSLFDLASAGCTGTPATNTVAVIQVPASINALPPFLYDVNFLNGICVKASAAMDITVSAQ